MRPVLLLSVMIALGVACDPVGSSSSAPEPAPAGASGSADPGAADPATSAGSTAPVQPAEAGSISRSASGAIEVSSPSRNAQVDRTLRVEGRARVFENRVNYRLRAQGRVIAEGSTMTRATEMGQFGPFEASLSWNGEGLAPGSGAELEVYATSPKDGTPDHVVSIPVLLK